jgi:hypothetical protein
MATQPRQRLASRRSSGGVIWYGAPPEPEPDTDRDRGAPYGLDRLPAPRRPARPPVIGRLDRWVSRAALTVLVVCGAMIALTGLRDRLVPDEDDLSPAGTVASAYWTAVQRHDAQAIRRVLCDADRLMLAPAGDDELLAKIYPGGRDVVGFAVTGEWDSEVPVVTVQVRRREGGVLRTVTRATPVTQQAGVFLVCFHRLGLPLGS